jgi:hypothetical protein
MTTPSVAYDASVIETMARRLLDRAHSIVILYSVLGVALGLLAMSGISIAIPAGNSFAWIAVVLLTLVGYAIGSDKAFSYKLRAQVLLCQVSIERNTAYLVHILGTQKQ